MHRLSRRAKMKRDAIFLVLGRRCARCHDSHNLEFDVIIPTLEAKSHHENFSWLQRINFYCRQLSCGNLQILCGSCNSKKNNSTARYIAPLLYKTTPQPF